VDAAELIDKHEAAARGQRRAARCFPADIDSFRSKLGVFCAQEEAKESIRRPGSRVKRPRPRDDGTLSGGTPRA